MSRFRSLRLALALCPLACGGPSTGLTSTNGGSAFSHPAGTLSGDNTWAAGTHAVNGVVTVSSGTLTIAAGANLQMASGAAVVIGKLGLLHVSGTSANPVNFTSVSLSPARGDWGGIVIENGALAGNTISYADFAYGGSGAGNNLGGAPGTLAVAAGCDVGIDHVSVQNSAGFGVSFVGDLNLKAFTGNTLIHNALGPLSLSAQGVGQLGPGTYAPNDIPTIQVLVSQLGNNASWGPLGVPYLLQGLSVQTLTGQVVLTINAGTTLLMAPNANLVVQKNGALVISGTASQPVAITSAANPAARGDWGALLFYINSIGSLNSISYTNIDFGGSSNVGAVWIESGATLAMQNTTITNSATVGMTIAPGGNLSRFVNNTLIKNAMNPISIDVNDVKQLGPGTYTPNAVEGILVAGSLVSTDSTWNALGVPYVISEDFNVDVNATSGSATLTLLANTTLQLKPSVTIGTNSLGHVLAIGTAAYPILITSFNEQQNWNELRFLSSGNQLKYVTLRFGGSGGEGSVNNLGSLAVTQALIGEISTSSTVPCSNSGTLSGAFQAASTMATLTCGH